MSNKVREWLMALKLFSETSHDDRVEIDMEVERRTRVNCDEAIERNMVTEQEFREIVDIVLQRKKKKRKEEAMMVV